MVNCAKCRTNIRIFQAKYNYQDENGNTINYCSKCNEEYQNKVTEERRKKLEKNKLEGEKLRESNTQEVSEYCKKYLSNKNFEFKGIILGIYKNKELFRLIEKDDLDFLKEHFIKVYQQTQDNSPSTSEEYDEVMSLESTCNDAWQLIQDMMKIKKLLEKKNIKMDYVQIINKMVEIVNEDMKRIIEKLTIPAYKRISKITTTNKKQIIKEYLKIGFDEPNEMIIEDLFDKFNLKYNSEEIIKLLNECLEEVELDDFEENLGLSNFKQIGDFETLNGHQFEDYLKDLFSILGYQVMRTKLSGDQGADLIIKKDDEKTVVQAKKYSGAVTNKAIQEVVASKNHYGCNKSIVVTTGVFTKSAIELAKSNKVELWDKNKLKKVINGINSSSINKKVSKSEQSVSLENDLFPFVCPFCSSKIRVNITELPKRNKSKKMTCPECSVDISMQIQEKFYMCSGCKQEFDIFKDRLEHTKTCKKIKERQFKCNSCDKEVILDDSEFKELKTTGKINVKCPVCNKSNTLKE